MAIYYEPSGLDPSVTRSFSGRGYNDPGNQAYAAHNADRIDAKYFLHPVQSNLMGLWQAGGGLANVQYSSTLWTCLAGLAVGDPVYISASQTVALALASTEPTSKVFGFVAEKPTSTTCYISHFYVDTGLAGLTPGVNLYLQDDGSVDVAPGTFPVIIGKAHSASIGYLYAGPVESVSGYSGISGVSGYSGLDGASGYSGAIGTSGYSGLDGNSGYSGVSGYSAASPGDSGYSGVSGWSGISGVSGPPGAVFQGCRVYQPSGVSVPSGYVAAQTWTTWSAYSGEDFDTIGMHDPVSNPNRITIQQAGYYQLSASMFNATSSGKIYIRIMRGNDSIVIATSGDHNIIAGYSSANANNAAVNSTGAEYIQTSGSVYCNVGDWFQVQIWRSSAVPPSATNPANNADIRFEAVLMGGGTQGYSGFSGLDGAFSASGYSGVSGYSAASPGDSGYSGISGIVGTSGYSGINGTNGTSGYSGISSNSGISGYSGTSGWSGISAFSGISGAVGPAGAQGYSGQSGAQGVSGVDGSEGSSGQSGYSGLSTSGYSGVIGSVGTSGFSGFSGQQGVSGWSGDNGLQGPTGTSGWSGNSGTSGLSGFSSVSGYSGFSGEGRSGYSAWSGPSGISGLSGISGFSSPSGISGYSGLSGLSAFSGFSAQSPGPQGIQGFSGLSGAAGTWTGTDTICYVLDGGEYPISNGIKGTLWYDFPFEIEDWIVLADQVGTIELDVWKTTYAGYPSNATNSICGTNVPAIINADKARALNMSGWTTTIPASSALSFYVTTCSAITRATLILKIRRT